MLVPPSQGDLDFSAVVPRPAEERKPAFVLSKDAGLNSADFEKKWFGLGLR